MVLFSSHSNPHCHRVRVVLAEKDIAVDIEYVDPDNLPEDLLHINPYHSIPTLRNFIPQVIFICALCYVDYWYVQV